MPQTIPNIGIDFGTANSLASVVKYNRFDKKISFKTLLPDGKKSIPSVVYIKNDESIIVGDKALELGKSGPTNFRKSVKMLLEYKSIEIGRHTVKTVDIVKALFIEIIKTAIAQYVDRELVDSYDIQSKIVVTAPARFNKPQCKIIQDALDELKFTRICANCNGKTYRYSFTEYQIQPEPVAAGYYYYNESGPDARKNITIAVVDIGAGTTDLAIIENTNGKLEVRSKDTTYTAGDLFDSIMKNLIRSKLTDSKGNKLSEKIKKTPLSQVDFYNLDNAAVETKEKLSAEHSAYVVFPFGGTEYKGTITRKEFEAAIEHDVDEIVTRLKNLIEHFNNTNDRKVNTIIYTGGSSQIPYIQNKIKEAIVTRPRHSIFPALYLPAEQAPDLNNAVCYGAGLYAGKLGTEPVDIASHSYGVGITKHGKPVVHNIIVRNGALIGANEEEFALKNGKTILNVKIYESDSTDKEAEPGNCEIIGELVIDKMLGAMPGDKVRVRFELDSKSKLIAHILHIRTGTRSSVEIKITG